MATFTGRDGTILIDNTAGTLTALAEIRSFTLDHTMDVIEDTVMTDSARTYKRGLEGSTFTAEVLYSNAEVATIQALALGRDAVTVEMYPSGNSSTNGKISGEALITGYSVSSSFDDMVTATVSGTFSGAITFATV